MVSLGLGALVAKFREKKPEPVTTREQPVRVLNPDRVVESYYVDRPFSKVHIVASSNLERQYEYFIEEVALSGTERQAYETLLALLEKELVPPEHMEVDPAEYVISEAERIANKYSRSFYNVDANMWDRINYYLGRDIPGYGALNVLIQDPNIEDISCNGVNRPIYVWHRQYESLPTNLIFDDEIEYNNMILKFAHLSNKHISSAYPMLDAMLPGKHRLAATFMKEVSSFGSTFCIRKFKSDPFTVVDLVRLGTIDAKLAAYFWTLIEHKQSLMIIGGTGAGKTSILNALAGLVEPNDKLVTVEDIAELNLHHENWVQFVCRKGFRFGVSETTSIALFDLIKLSLRYRPDYIIVGEVRGEEAYVLFQALATGHGGLCTMHADNLDYAVKRLTSPPMNVSDVYIPLMNVCLEVSRVELPASRGAAFGRRVKAVSEIRGVDEYVPISSWVPVVDTFKTDFADSQLLNQIAVGRGMNKAMLLQEMADREDVIRTLASSDMRSAGEIASEMMNYAALKKHAAPRKVLEPQAEAKYI